jgi:hypothetical protein
VEGLSGKPDRRPTLQRLPTSERTCPCNGSAPLTRHYNMGLRKPLPEQQRENGPVLQECSATISTYRNPRSGSQFVQVNSHERSNDRCTQSNPFRLAGVGSSISARQATISDDVHLQPQQHKRQQSTTQLPQQFYRVQPYKAGASYACRSVLEEVTEGGWCASKLGLGPEYPGLQYDVRDKE